MVGTPRPSQEQLAARHCGSPLPPLPAPPDPGTRFPSLDPATEGRQVGSSSPCLNERLTKHQACRAEPAGGWTGGPPTKSGQARVPLPHPETPRAKGRPPTGRMGPGGALWPREPEVPSHRAAPGTRAFGALSSAWPDAWLWISPAWERGPQGC